MQNIKTDWFDWAIGLKLKRLRTKQKKTLKEAANAIGTTPQFISAVEKGLSGISLSKLNALLQFYQTSFSDSFSVSSNTSPLIHLEDAESFDIGDDKIYTAFLFHPSQRPPIEPLYHRLSPGAQSKFSQHEGVEFFYLISGTLICTLENPETGEINTYHMSAGDSLHITSNTLHSVVCPGPQVAEVLAVSQSRGRFHSAVSKDDLTDN